MTTALLYAYTWLATRSLGRWAWRAAIIVVAVYLALALLGFAFQAFGVA